ncbi:MAG: DUF3667 domain-containing protein [Flavobacteriales bacterium]|nr:DUF3667 domain-containing protein [Flavobacteriales bacterium]
MNAPGTCANCGATVTGDFCSACGQKHPVSTFNWRYLLMELPAGLFAVDKGVVPTVRELFTRPGHMIRDYLGGKRVRYFRPLSLLVLSAGLYGFISVFFELRIPGLNMGEQTDAKKMIDAINRHYALMELGLLPLMSFSTWLFFLRSGYNFVEHLVVNAFLSAQRIIVTLVLLPLMFATNGTMHVVEIASLGNVLSFLLFIWSLIQLFQGTSAVKVTLKSIGAYVLSYILLFLLIVVGAAVLKLMHLI